MTADDLDPIPVPALALILDPSRIKDMGAPGYVCRFPSLQVRDRCVIEGPALPGAVLAVSVDPRGADIYAPWGQLAPYTTAPRHWTRYPVTVDFDGAAGGDTCVLFARVKAFHGEIWCDETGRPVPLVPR